MIQNIKKTIQIMGILNITPDSFSDGGDFVSSKNAVIQAKKMRELGADIIDIGGESTAPHSQKISAQEEWKRIKKSIIELHNNSIPLSVDSYKSEIWKKAVLIDEKIIFNDVSGLRVETDTKIKILQKNPQTKVIIMFSRNITQKDPDNIMEEIIEFFNKQLHLLEQAGIEKNRIIIDPGMGGFLSQNSQISFEVIRNLQILERYNCDILVGTSRKSFLRNVSDKHNPKNREIASVITAIESAKNGANILRVHDIKSTKEALETCNCIYPEKT